jgi:hypothetical protein
MNAERTGAMSENNVWTSVEVAVYGIFDMNKVDLHQETALRLILMVLLESTYPRVSVLVSSSLSFRLPAISRKKRVRLLNT